MQAVSAFCESQEIKDVDNFMYLCFKQGFDIKRYGLLGKTLNDGEKDLIKEVIVEKRVEIPVEVIKEVEKIVEVPVEKIVTNIEYIRDQKIENELFGKIEQLENETAKKNEELDELSQTLDELRQKLDIKEDNDKVKLLQQTIQNIRSELQQKNEQIKELEKINRDLLNGNQNQAYLLRGSNLNRRI